MGGSRWCVSLRKLPGSWALGAVCVLPLLAPSTVSAQLAPDARRFMLGGTFCFELKQPRVPDWRETFKLVVTPAGDQRGTPLVRVDGLMHGVRGKEPRLEYLAQMIGSAVVAPRFSAPQTGGRDLLIGMTSNQAGTYDDLAREGGVWTGDYAFTLDVSRLSGRVIGTKRFRGIRDGELLPLKEDAVDGTVSLIQCTGF